MANEITYQTKLKALKGNFFLPEQSSGGKTATLSTGGSAQMEFDTVVGTAASITFTGLTTPRWCRIVNVHDTASFEFGVFDAGAFRVVGELKPAEEAMWPLKAGVVLYHKGIGAVSKGIATALET